MMRTAGCAIFTCISEDQLLLVGYPYSGTTIPARGLVAAVVAGISGTAHPSKKMPAKNAMVSLLLILLGQGDFCLCNFSCDMDLPKFWGKVIENFSESFYLKILKN